MEIIMVLISLTGGHLGMNQRKDTKEVEGEHVKPQKGRIGIYVIDGYDLLARDIHMLFDKSRYNQIFKYDYLLCERIHHAIELLR